MLETCACPTRVVGSSRKVGSLILRCEHLIKLLCFEVFVALDCDSKNKFEVYDEDGDPLLMLNRREVGLRLFVGGFIDCFLNSVVDLIKG